jgi:hypothetical protein
MLSAFSGRGEDRTQYLSACSPTLYPLSCYCKLVLYFYLYRARAAWASMPQTCLMSTYLKRKMTSTFRELSACFLVKSLFLNWALFAFTKSAYLYCWACAGTLKHPWLSVGLRVYLGDCWGREVVGHVGR